jgi:hypothetical protein
MTHDEEGDEIIRRLKTKLMNIRIEKTEVVAMSRKLSANWSVGEALIHMPYVRNVRLTKDEEADEIIKRLSAPPKSKYDSLEDEICDKLATQITAEIDAMIIRELRIDADKKTKNTP